MPQNNPLESLKTLNEVYNAQYRGIVRNSFHPDENGMIQVEVLPMFKDLKTDYLPWAAPKYPLNRLLIPHEGATVWVFFEGGDIYKPVYECAGTLPIKNLKSGDTHNWKTVEHGDPSYSKTQAKEKRDADDASKVVGTEPPLAAAPSYPYNDIYLTPGGHLVEFDDTPDSERVFIRHKTGTFYEIDKDGNLHVRTVGNKLDYVKGNETEHVKGDELSTVEGKSTENITGDKSIDSANLYISVDGVVQVVGDHVLVNADRIDLNP